MSNYQTGSRGGFTLIELLLVIAIIGILSGLGLSIMAGAEQDALEKRTRAGIERISQSLARKLEENVYRILPVRPPDGATPQEVREFRETALAELLRVEFPDNIADTVPASFPQNSGVIGAFDFDNDDFPVPQKMLRFEARVGGATATNEGAECLYAILSLYSDEHGVPLISLLRDREIKDTDNDGFLEVVDAFGDPLNFSVIDATGAPLDPTTPQLPQDYRFSIWSGNIVDALATPGASTQPTDL